MTAAAETEMKSWREILARVGGEWRGLPAAERAWILHRLGRIGRLQQRLHRFFLLAGGPVACAQCLGACCERGRHHLTLVNVLGFLGAGRLPPEPDFGRTCPFLGPEGCLIGVELRPFNCVTFLCETIEDRLDPSRRRTFYALEGRLRRHYQEFDGRYAGSSLRGLFIRASGLGDRPFLAPAERGGKMEGKEPLSCCPGQAPVAGEDE